MLLNLHKQYFPQFVFELESTRASQLQSYNFQCESKSVKSFVVKYEYYFTKSYFYYKK